MLYNLLHRLKQHFHTILLHLESICFNVLNDSLNEIRVKILHLAKWTTHFNCRILPNCKSAVHLTWCFLSFFNSNTPFFYIFSPILEFLNEIMHGCINKLNIKSRMACCSCLENDGSAVVLASIWSKHSSKITEM